MPAESLSPVAIWRKEARRKDPQQGAVPDESVRRVAELLLQAEPDADKPLSVSRSMALRASLRRFLADERACFTKERATTDRSYAEAPWLIEGKCYWAAWLMALAVKRPAMTAARSEEIRKDFATLADAIASRADPAHAALYKRALTERFQRLHPDVLFPALKEPLPAAVREQLVDYVIQARKSLLAEPGDDVPGPEGPTTRKAGPASAKAAPKAPAILPEDTIPTLVSQVMIQLVYRTARPDLTEYWGYMKSADYSPGSASNVRGLGGPAWPVSLAFVPDTRRNELNGWRRGGGSAPTTRPAAPATAPAPRPAGMPPSGSSEGDWSPPVAGLRGRISAGIYIASRLASRVAVQVWNVAGAPVRVDAEFAAALHVRIADAKGHDVPSARLGADASPRWIVMAPGESAGKILGRSVWKDVGAAELKLGTHSWVLGPGTYTLYGTIKSPPAWPGQPADAWTGQITLPPVRLEVFADADPGEFAKAVVAARSANAAKSKAEYWQALAQLVTPGMTVADMLVALPPAVRQRPDIQDRGTYFFISYPVDLDFGVKAVAVVQGTDRKVKTLTSRPSVVRLHAAAPPPATPPAAGVAPPAEPPAK